MHTIRAGTAGLKHISLGKNFVAVWSGSKIDQDESPRVLRFHIVRRSLESMFVPHDLQYCCPIFWIDVDLSGNKLAAREVRSFSPYYEVLYHSNQEACSGILEQQANSRIFWREEHLLVNIQRHWLEKGNTEICLHNATEVGAFASQDTGASRCPRQETRGGTEIPTNLYEHWILSHCEWLTCSSVILPDISSDEAIIAWTSEERRKNLPFPRYTRKP